MPFLITDHALKRWAERGLDTPIETAVREALPFGAQYGGNNYLLRYRDVVFAVRRRYDTDIVRTVLTLDYAIANMQASGLRVAGEPAVGGHPAPSPADGAQALDEHRRSTAARKQYNKIAELRALRQAMRECLSDDDFDRVHARMAQLLLALASTVSAPATEEATGERRNAAEDA